MEKIAGEPLNPNRGRRKVRAIPRFRPTVRAGTSVWSLPAFSLALAGRINKPVSAKQFVGGYGVHYTLLQRLRFISEGQYGPLTPWNTADLSLAHAYFKSKGAVVQPPGSWDRERYGQFCYKIADTLDTFHQHPSAKVTVKQALARGLRQARLPPLTVPTLVVPRVLRKRLGALRRGVLQAVEHMQTAVARDRILEV